MLSKVCALRSITVPAPMQKQKSEREAGLLQAYRSLRAIVAAKIAAAIIVPNKVMMVTSVHLKKH